MRIPRSRRSTAAAAVAIAVLTLAACSAGSGDSGADAGGVAPGPAGVAEGEAADEGGALADGASVENASARDADAPGMEKAIISTGNVALESTDVEQAAFDIQQVADRYAGQITDQKTTTDDEGDVRHARMVLRVPAADFDAAFAELEDVADLTSSSSTSEDVTTQVIDNQVRIEAQRRSIRRIAVLLDRATSIRDIVSIESQLTRRQADLDSLEQQQAYLKDQTSLSTITVTVERTATPDLDEEEDESGFLAGLSDGWDALGSFGSGVATLTGNVLPFAAVLLLIGVPGWLLVRGAVRRRPKGAPPADATA